MSVGCSVYTYVVCCTVYIMHYVFSGTVCLCVHELCMSIQEWLVDP